eukprot:CAMPEP_0194149138 /NCGR_PEP_ID=MMETSP0152-20130528/36453_1 /TAXON_ID=1049557 /ORGANISM="Thalassiothrix antarctica, Strain L6-D1" /LENGTH=209 /DNA_ID=CAMNT_0038851123 /DNA_START=23 /DNA_END=652 /DNA_ORIENTATION=-
MNYIKNLMKRSNNKEEDEHKFELLENELESIYNGIEENTEKLRNVRNQRVQAQKLQAQKVIYAEQYLDFLSMQFKKLVREQQSFRYQQELLTAYHKKKEDGSSISVPLPYILMKQAKLLKCCHLVEVYSNQSKMIKKQMKNFRRSMTQQKTRMLNSVENHHDGNSKEKSEDGLILIGKEQQTQQLVPERSCLKHDNLMIMNKMPPVVMY